MLRGIYADEMPYGILTRLPPAPGPLRDAEGCDFKDPVVPANASQSA